MRTLMILVSMLTSSSLFSQLSFRNTSTEEVYIAIKYLEQDIWKTSGWYKVGPLQTEQIFGKVNNRYYYYYAYYYSNEGKTVWSGNDTWSWVHRKNAFTTIDGNEYLSSEGFEKIGLKKIDLKDSKSFTVTLDFRSKFQGQMDDYFQKSNLDPIEGLYSISDEITIESSDFWGNKINKREIKNHWAKVAIIKDTLSLSRSYLEFVVESNEFQDGYVRAEFLETSQSHTIFMTKQRHGNESKSVVLEYKQDIGIIEGKFDYVSSGKRYYVLRSYLKYFPKN